MMISDDPGQREWMHRLDWILAFQVSNGEWIHQKDFAATVKLKWPELFGTMEIREMDISSH